MKYVMYQFTVDPLNGSGRDYREGLPSFFSEGPSEKLLGDRGGEGKNIHASET